MYNVKEVPFQLTNLAWSTEEEENNSEAQRHIVNSRTAMDGDSVSHNVNPWQLPLVARLAECLRQRFSPLGRLVNKFHLFLSVSK